MVITGFDLSTIKDSQNKHWSKKFFINRPTIISKEETLGNRIEKIKKVQILKDQRTPFLLYVEHSHNEIWGAELPGHPDLEKINEICFFDRLKSICEGDCYNFRYAKSLRDYGEKPLTPIEVRLKEGLIKAGLSFEPQVKIGRFIVDFLINHEGKKLIVEADGQQYHVPDKDKLRDEEIYNEFQMETIRFGGSKIIQNVGICISEIQEKLKGLNSSLPNYGYEDLEYLDDSQKSAIEHEFGSARVVAPAGSGKTKVLVNRVIRLLNEGIKPSGILCLAFNRDAADQLQSRLKQLRVKVSSPRYSNESTVNVATFNSLGIYVLRRFASIEDGVLTEKQQKKIAEQIFKETFKEKGVELRPLRGYDPYEDFFKGMSKVKAGLSSPLEQEIEIKVKEDESVKTPFSPIFDRVEEQSLKTNQVSFEGQIYYAVKHLLSNYKNRNILQDTFSHLIVDEYQDLNPAQVALLRILVAKQKEVFAVGDDDQLIYSWRHVDPNNILGFEKFFPSMGDYPLSINYRCAKKILKTTSQLIQYNNPHRLEKKIEPYHKNPDGSTNLYIGDELFKQMEWVIEHIKESKEKKSASYSSFAILTRYNATQFIIAYALDKAGIPRTKLKHTDSLYNMKVVEVLISYVKVITNPKTSEPEDWIKIINEPNRYLTNKFVGELKGKVSVYSYLKAILKLESKLLEKPPFDADLEKPKKAPPPRVKYEGGELTSIPKSLGEKWRSKHLRDFLSDLDYFSKELKNKSPTEIIEAIMDSFQFSKREEATNSNAEDLADDLILDLIKEDARQFSDLHEFYKYVAEQKELDEESSMEKNSEQEKTSNLDTAEETSKVTISSIHRAKGKEWENVVLFDLHDPNKTSKGESDKKIDRSDIEERRVHYVGMTRARLNLFVTGRIKNRSPFMEEAFVWPELLKKKDKALPFLENRTKVLRKEIAEIKSELEPLKNFKEVNLNEQRKLKQLIESSNNSLQRAHKMQTGSIFGQVLSGKPSEKMKHERIRGIQQQLDNYKTEFQVVLNQSKRDIGSEKKEKKKLIKKKKAEVKSFQPMIEILSKIYENTLEG